MPENKYCYVISDQFENIIGAATTMKKALGMVEEEDMDEVEVSSGVIMPDFPQGVYISDVAQVGIKRK